MKITKSQLKQIIKEELGRVTESQESSYGGLGPDGPEIQHFLSMERERQRPKRPEHAEAFDLGHKAGMTNDWRAEAGFVKKHGKDSRETFWFRRGWDNASEEELMLRSLRKDPIERRAFLAVHRRKPTHNIGEVQ
jgi:hypothetical protein